MVYYCYLISNEIRTYIGITNNLESRLAKHNAKKGAKATRAGNAWTYKIIIGEFANRSTASSFEWYFKHHQTQTGKWIRTPAGIDNKIKRVNELLSMDQWKYLSHIK
jgi:predicted GIY-YIG superfamily endonuclease